MLNIDRHLIEVCVSAGAAPAPDSNAGNRTPLSVLGVKRPPPTSTEAASRARARARARVRARVRSPPAPQSPLCHVTSRSGPPQSVPLPALSLMLPPTRSPASTAASCYGTISPATSLARAHEPAQPISEATPGAPPPPPLAHCCFLLLLNLCGFSRCCAQTLYDRGASAAACSMQLPDVYMCLVSICAQPRCLYAPA